jgi:hypothetical protein
VNETPSPVVVVSSAVSLSPEVAVVVDPEVELEVASEVAVASVVASVVELEESAVVEDASVASVVAEEVGLVVALSESLEVSPSVQAGASVLARAKVRRGVLWRNRRSVMGVPRSFSEPRGTGRGASISRLFTALSRDPIRSPRTSYEQRGAAADDHAPVGGSGQSSGCVGR